MPTSKTAIEYYAENCIAQSCDFYEGDFKCLQYVINWIEYALYHGIVPRNGGNMKIKVMINDALRQDNKPSLNRTLNLLNEFITSCTTFETMVIFNMSEPNTITIEFRAVDGDTLLASTGPQTGEGVEVPITLPANTLFYVCIVFVAGNSDTYVVNAESEQVVLPASINTCGVVTPYSESYTVNT